DIAEHPKVFRDLRLRHGQVVHDLPDGFFAGHEHVENLATACLGYRVEHVGRRGCSGHALNIFRYRNMSTDLWAAPFEKDHVAPDAVMLTEPFATADLPKACRLVQGQAGGVL